MPVLEAFLLNQFGTFVLVLARVGGLVATAPIFGTKAAPMQARAVLAVAMALIVTPLQSASPAVDLGQLLPFAKLVLNETLLGVLLGMGVMILLSGVELTGQIVAQMGGTAIADGFDLNFDENAPVYSQMFYFLTLTMFVLLDGHRLLVEALLDTYAWLPPGKAALGDSLVEALTTLLGHSFALGVRAAAPAITALLLATIVLGLISRTVPQINILAVGFNLNALLTIGGLAASIGAVAWAFPQQTVAAIELLTGAIHQTADAAGSAVAP
jgi:flagellar biosynthetic protein FliR